MHINTLATFVKMTGISMLFII